MRQLRGLILIYSIIFSLFVSITSAEEQVANASIAQNEPAKEQAQFVGKFFDVQVPLENYLFIKGVLTVFGSRGAPQPKTPEEAEKTAWDELLLSYEAFRIGITINQEEIDGEIGKMLQAEKVSFDRKKDKDAYAIWVKEKTNEPVKLFENQINHLLQIQKLRQRIMDNITPDVSKKEAFREFLNEHNSLSVELAEFEEKATAEEFYKKAIRKPGFWDEERGRRPKDFKQIGMVSLEFLMDIWKFPADAVYKMMKMKKGSFHFPEPIYKGYGVFRVIDTSPADDKDFSRLKDSYYEQIRIRKKYKGLEEWFENLKKQANIIIYPKK